MSTIADIEKQFETERASMAALDEKLSDEDREIRDKIFQDNVAATDAQKKRLSEIETDRMKLASSLQTLALTTLDGLKTASDIDTITDAMKKVNGDLDGTLQRLARQQRYAADAQAVAQGLTKIVGKLADLRPSLL